MKDILYLFFTILGAFEVAVAYSYVSVARLVVKEIERGNDHIQIVLPPGYMPLPLFKRHPVLTHFFKKEGAFGLFLQLGASGFWNAMCSFSFGADLGKVPMLIGLFLFVASILLYYLISAFMKLAAGKKVMVGMERGP